MIKGCSESDNDIWLTNVNRLPTNHCDDRECKLDSLHRYVDLLVIHNISLPPARHEGDFADGFVEQFFTGELDPDKHPYFQSIADMRVSSHLYIKRNGDVVQFVPLNKRAWHAGVSSFKGRSKCNDFSIGIELQGADHIPYTKAQYDSLVTTTKQIQQLFGNINKEHVVGHCDIAPGRKTDPGSSFDWDRYKTKI